MRPRKLVMQAFGSYGKKTLIDFTRTNQNLFLIAGNTGAGKTTIFDAMVFALYGEASSESNRKDGKELQSQFEDFGVEPFVELDFSETEGEEERLYRVRRAPRHLRPIARGRNKGGFRECQESVSLFLPDGSEYPGNKGETDGKLEEIVGLTKSQFMQVAMIAQGEFMELLRAKSEEKKVIFRKLFHTEIFQQVVEDLARRRKDMESGIEQVQLDCKKDAGRARIPEAYDGGGLAALQRSILTPGKLNITDLEKFLEGLDVLCGKLEKEMSAAQKEQDELSRRRDDLLKDSTRARQLMKSFEELEKAEAELADCEAREAEMQESRKLLGRIRDAYELRSLYDRYQDGRKALEEREKGLRFQRERLPLLTEQEKAAAEKEEAAGKAMERVQAAFSKTEDRVGKALELLKKLDDAKGAVTRRRALLTRREKAVNDARKALEEFEERERDNRRQAEELGDVGTAAAQLEAKEKEANGIAEDASRVKKAQEEVREQGLRVKELQKAYRTAGENYTRHHESFLEKQRAFLDAQAGLLAREKLRPGEPCPVCGSTEHPNPCILSQEHRELTREVMEELAREDERLNREQNEKSEATREVRAVCEEKERSFRELAEKLRKRMEESVGNLPEKMTLQQAADILARWQGKLREETSGLAQRKKALEAAQAFLSTAEEKKQALKKELERLSDQTAAARADLAAAEATAEQLAGQRDYPTEETARRALREAAAAKETAEKAHQGARREAGKARSDREGAETLIRRYEGELPELREETTRRRSACDAMEKEKGLTESRWKEIVEKHRKEEPEEIQSRLEEHSRRKSAAEGAKRAAREAIGEQRKPNIEELETTSREIEERWKAAKTRWEDLKELFRIDDDVCRALKPQMEERSRMVREFSRLDGLHGRLAGKVSGARMDIETFVQRYYLEQVLQAANERFIKMSAGQFELRMTEDAQAGAGKNRGLDLMVYSAVTGKVREIRTLSGGESFMAALSLALGMADQIQENSAAIRLEVMFIDEGFGSLDDHARNQAVKVLQQVAGGSRLIGIISHVSELRQEIENQLLVSKDEEGSHAKWVIS